LAQRPVRVASIDLGKARAGVAVADELGLYAHARPFVDATSRKPLLEALKALAVSEKLERFLVGLPLELGGGEGPAARRALKFAQELADATGVEVELVDERLTTVEAARQLRASGRDARQSKSKVDGVAAAIVLQRWLDAR
jgi:putative Holliday junction resolvase